MNLLIRLPHDRTKLGTIQMLTQDGTILVSAECLGKSDNAFAAAQGNPTRDPKKRGGDLPYGSYKCDATRFHEHVSEGDEHSYGPHGYIRLTPTAGDALIAASEGKRSGLLIHGGALNPAYTATRGLRPTHGCLRVTDETILAMLNEVDKRPEEPLTCGVVLETI